MSALPDSDGPNQPGPIEAISYNSIARDYPARRVWLFASTHAADQTLAALLDMGAESLELRRHSLQSAQAVIRCLFDEGLELDELWRDVHARGWLMEVHKAVEAARRAAANREILPVPRPPRRSQRVRRRSGRAAFS